MQSIADFFVDVWKIPAARGVIGLAVIVTLVLTLVYVIKKFRGAAFGNQKSAVLDHLSDFRKMLDEGRINQQDFKRLKKELSKQALEESKGMNDTDLQGDFKLNQIKKAETHDHSVDDFVQAEFVRDDASKTEIPPNVSPETLHDAPITETRKKPPSQQDEE